MTEGRKDWEMKMHSGYRHYPQSTSSIFSTEGSLGVLPRLLTIGQYLPPSADLLTGYQKPKVASSPENCRQKHLPLKWQGSCVLSLEVVNGQWSD